MKEMTKQEWKDHLTRRIEGLERTQKTLLETIELRNQDLQATRGKLYIAQQEAAKDREAAFTIRRALEAETHGLRQELAQAQSALYTLINKLPETL